MSFKSFIKGLVVTGLAIATGGASLAYEAVAAAGAYLASGTVGAMVARAVLAIGISKLVSNRAGTKAAGGDAPSARFMPPVSTTNKIPLVYGSAYTGPVLTDAIISTDNTTMWYVLACSEVTDTGSMSFGEIYLDNRLISLGAPTFPTQVVSLTNNAGQVDTTISGNMYLYKFSNGSSSGVNTSQTAIQILQDSAIPVDRRWTSTDTMDNTAFIIIKLIYNVDKQVTGLGQIKVNMINSLTKPGDVLLDYMQNTRYGCAIPLSQIDTTSLTALNTYSDALITYTPVGGGTATQARYRINGPLDLSTNCLSNLQDIADACDSWLQYSELVGKWKVVINKPYSGTLSSLYSIDSSVLIGGIDIIPLDLNQTFNSVEVQYPNNPIKDQTDVRVIDLTDPTTDWYRPDLLSPNEAANRLTIQYQIVNNYVQAVYLGVRRLLQSREDLTITCNLDYSGIQIEAGDVVRVTLEEYGWVDKLFRVSTVTEIKQSNGNLGASIVAFEYNDDVFADNAIQNFVPADNTGINDPNIISQPGTPTITTNTLTTSGAVTSFTVTTTVPTDGTVLYMDFNYGNTSNVQTHKSYSSLQNADGIPYTNGQTLSIDINDLPIGNYYFSTTARNKQAGRASNSSSVYNWGANLQANSVTFNNMNSTVTVQQFLGGYTYEVSNQFANTVTLPININTLGNVNSTPTGNWAVPKYINATYSGTGGLFPYAQGNALTTQGYAANSTAAYTPANSAQLVLQNGDLNWYALEFSPLTGGTIGSGETLQTNYSGQLLSTTDCVIQLAPFVTVSDSGYANLGITDTSSGLFSYVLNAGMPTNVVIRYGQRTGTTVTGGGIFIRNLTTSANVVAVSSSFQLAKSK